MEVEKSWLRFLLNGGYLYRVTKLEIEEMYDGQFYDIENLLMDFENVDEWDYFCWLKPHIKEWLEGSCPRWSWRAEKPRYMGDKNLGVLFRSRKYILMFKLACG